jgi:hypothetical protein
MAETTLATLQDVARFFGMSLAEFKTEWQRLDTKSKVQLREGIGNGSFTY